MPVLSRSQPATSPEHAEPVRRWQRSTAAIAVLAAAASTLPSGAAEHVVSPGEVLSGIADDHDVSLDELVALNDLVDPDVIYAGQVLELPGADVRSEATAPERVHVVAAGESIWQIARRYDTTVDVLVELNGLADASLIFIDQEIRLDDQRDRDDVVVDTDEGAGLTDEATGAPVVHTVEAGDTLSGIATTYGVDLDVLLASNGLALDSIIVPGQAIVIGTHATEFSAEQLRDLPPDLLSDPDRLALLPVFDHWAAQYGVEPSLVKSLAWFESGWNNELVSSAGALGIGQVLPITADFVSEVLLGETLDPLVPEENIRLSIRYLRYLLDETDDVALGIASYYQGLTATRRHGIYSSSQFYVDGILALRSRFD